MDQAIKHYIKKESNISKEFVNKFYNIVSNNVKYISYVDIRDYVGYRKDKIITIARNDKYNFIEGTDYVITKQKSTGGRPGNMIKLHIDTAKIICMMSPTKKGHEFRKYYVQMDRLFKQYMSTELKNKISNPIHELNKYDFDINAYNDKEVLYLINVENDMYKFGITSNLHKRLNNHKNNLHYSHVIKCWDCVNRTVSKQIENDIKKYIKYNKLNKIYKKQTEIIQTDSVYSIVDTFNIYVDKHIIEYNNKFKNIQLEQELNIINAKIKLLETLKNTSNTININVNIDTLYNNDTDLNTIIGGMKDTKGKVENEIDDNLNNICDTPDPIDEVLKDMHFCKRCRSHKKPELFGKNPINNTQFKQCIKCREEGKLVDHKRQKSDKRLEWKKQNGAKYNKKYKEKKINATPNGHKYCSRCRTHQPMEFFGNKKNGKRCATCESCRKKDRDKKKREYERNKKKILKRNKKYYDKNKDQIIEQKRDSRVRKLYTNK